MWHKYYQRAEAQFSKSNFKLALQHCQRALTEAQAAGTIEQLAMTLSLLTLLYFENNNPLTVDTAQQSVNASGMAFGTDSIEWAEEIEMLAEAYYARGDIDHSIDAHRKALIVFEKKSPPERYLEYADGLMDLYLEVGRYADGEQLFLKALNARKRLYGPLSRAVFAQIPQYTEMLKAQGKTSEERRIDSLLDMCVSCGWTSSHLEHAPEVEKLLETVREAGFLGSQRDVLGVNRACIEKLELIVEQQQKSVADNHPFRELKVHDYATPLYWLRRRFATLLREQSYISDNPATTALLREAAAQLRGNLQTYINHCDEFHLMCVLLELAKHESSAFSELLELTRASTNLTAAAFTRALALYRREGPTNETVIAMSQALQTNPHVLPALFRCKYGDPPADPEDDNGPDSRPLDNDDLADAYNLIVDWPANSYEEAGHYFSYAKVYWLVTGGAIDFLEQTSRSHCRPSQPALMEFPFSTSTDKAGDTSSENLWATQWELG